MSLVLTTLAASLLLTQTPPPLSEPKSAQALFEQAARAELDGRGDEARAMWHKVAANVHNADVEYNLGTSYGNAGDFGLAVLHLKRAQLLRPSTEAAQNLQRVREKFLEANPGRARELSLLADIADNLVRVPLGLFFAAAAALAAVCAVLRFGAPPRGGAAVLVGLNVGLGVATMSAALLAVRYHYHDVRAPAVIVKRTAAKGGPDERFKTVAELPPGEEVRLRDEAGALGFVAIELSNGQLAYVTSSHIQRVKDWAQ